MKKCVICGVTKEFNEFTKCKRIKDGHYSQCRICKRDREKEFHARNKEKISLRRRKLYLINKDKILAQQKKYRRENAETVYLCNRKWQANNPEKVKEYRRQWENKNKDKLHAAMVAWRKANPDKYRAQMKRANRVARRTLRGRLIHSISAGIIGSIERGSKKRRHWEDLVGYTVDQLKKHLEKQFVGGMSWDNYGEWHIDHIIPIRVFNFSTPEDIDFNRCWALKNLRPLWRVENLRKRDKVDKPFQPSLEIAVPEFLFAELM